MQELAESGARQLADRASRSCSTPRLQRLTLEIILRAVFGLEQGRQLDSLRDLLTQVLGFQREPPVGAAQPPSGSRPGCGPLKQFQALSERVDREIFALIEERRAAPAQDAVMTCSACCSRPAMRTAVRCRHKSSATS